MIELHLKLFLPNNRVDEAIRTLRSVIGPTLVQTGCIESCIYQDPLAQNVILYKEEWNSWKNLENQIRSERFTQILKIMEMCTESPELSIDSIQESRGMEYVEQIRLPGTGQDLGKR